MTLPEISPQTRLLKANDIRGLGSKVVFNFDDLRRRGDDYLANVQKQAQNALAQAESQVEVIRKEAQERGLEEGRQLGLARVEELIEKRARELAEKISRETLATTLPAMKAAAETLSIERERWLAQWEATAVRLAAAIAQRIVRQRLDLDPERSLEMIRNALQLAAGVPHILLKVHPDDAALLGDHAEATVQSLAVCGRAEVVADAALTRGSCVIETRHGAIDGRVETLLDRIVSELLELHA